MRGKVFSFDHPMIPDGAMTPNKLYHLVNPLWYPIIKIHVDFEFKTPNELGDNSVWTATRTLDLPLHPNNPEVSLAGGGIAGDINADGYLDVVDVLTLMDSVLNQTPLTPAQQALGDHSGDGQVDISDVVSIVTEILGG